MPASERAFLFKGKRGLFSLKNMLSGSGVATAVQSAPATTTAAIGTASLLCREAVFDRQDRLAGHLFRLHETSLQADAPGDTQKLIDRRLLEILGASQEAWNTQLAFIPIRSDALEEAAIERLPTKNLVLFIRLSLNDSDTDALYDRLRRLHQRGIRIGLLHQPWHPAFARLRPLADYGVCDIPASDPEAIRDFPAVFGSRGETQPLFAANIDSLDEHRLCRLSGFSFFHGRFAATIPARPPAAEPDPHKAQLLNLLRLVEGHAETPEIAEAMKHTPVLTFRILRYLNSPAIGLNHRIDSISQALIMLGRQRLSRWLTILLFSVNGASFSDWLLVEAALTRGRLMEELSAEQTPPLSPDALFLTGMLSCLDRLLHRPLAEIIDELPLSDEIRSALLEQRGPFAPLLAVAIASETLDAETLRSAAHAAGLSADDVNRALLAATAWACEVTEHWE